MTRYVVAGQDTGEIVSIINCDEAQAEAAAAAGGVVVVESADATPKTHYVSGGAAVGYTPEQAAAKASRPTYDAEWSNVAMTWVDQRTIDRAKIDKRAEIKKARDAANDAPKATTYGTFDAFPEARANITSVAAMAQTAAKYGSTAPIKFTLANNQRASFTLAEFESAALQVGAQVQANFDKADLLLQQIDEATTIEAVEAVVW